MTSFEILYYTVWIIGIPLVYVIVNFCMGILASNEMEDIGIILPSLFVAFTWPLLIILAVGYLFLIGPAKLGRYLFNREKKS